MFFLPLLIAGAAAGGGLAFWQAKEQNSAAKKAGEANLQAARIETEQQYAAMLDQQYKLSQVAGSNLGAVYNAKGFSSGGAMSSYIAQMLQDANLDSQALTRGQANVLKSYEFRAKGIQAQTSSQMVNPFISTLQGTIQGAAMGASLGGALDSFATKAALSSALQGSASQFAANPAMSIANSQALINGVPPSLLSNPGVMAPFYANANALVAANASAIQNMTAASSLGLGFTAGNIFAPGGRR